MIQEEGNKGGQRRARTRSDQKGGGDKGLLLEARSSKKVEERAPEVADGPSNRVKFLVGHWRV